MRAGRARPSGRARPAARAVPGRARAGASATAAGSAAARRRGRRGDRPAASAPAASPRRRAGDRAAAPAAPPWRPRARRSGPTCRGLRPRAALRRRQPRRHPHQPLTRTEQRPLEPAGHLPAVLDRPQPLLAKRARPREQRLAVDRAVCSATRRGRPRRRRPPSASACVRPLQPRSFRSPPPRMGATGERTDLNRGSCQAPIRSRSTVSGRRRRHNAGKSAHGRHPGIESAAANPSLCSTADDTHRR